MKAKASLFISHKYNDIKDAYITYALLSFVFHFNHKLIRYLKVKMKRYQNYGSKDVIKSMRSHRSF